METRMNAAATTPITQIATPARRIVGLALRTDNSEGFKTIPAHWQRFMDLGVPATIAGKRSDDVFAVYTHFENLDVLAVPGGIAQLRYTLLLGVEVTAGAEPPAGLQAVDVPAQTCAVFTVPKGRLDLVAARWQDVWALQELPRAFAADIEHYWPDGVIELLVGLR
jgi:predicted transcriptional regulator YdeE